jgi:hypothetical protein
MQEIQDKITAGATPILDSAIRRKKPRRKRFGATLVGVLVGLIFASVMITAAIIPNAGKNAAVDPVPLVFAAALVLAVVIHEGGHLLAGWFIGFEFSSVQIGPFSLNIEYGLLKVRMRKQMPAAGYAGMQIAGVRRLRHRLLIFIAGGPVANLLSFLGCALFFVFLQRPFNGRLASAAFQFGAISLVLGLTNFLPFTTASGMSTDGKLILIILRGGVEARRWLCAFASGSQLLKGVRPRNLNRNWLKMACSTRSETIYDFSGNWLSYMAANDRKDVPVAAFHLERSIELIDLLGKPTQQVVALEAAVFTAWFRHDVELAQKWLRQITVLKEIPMLSRIRGDVAMSCARKEYENALVDWQKGFAFIEKLPASPRNQRLRDGWMEWKDEIVERQNSSALNQVLS